LDENIQGRGLYQETTSSPKRSDPGLTCLPNQTRYLRHAAGLTGRWKLQYCSQKVAYFANPQLQGVISGLPSRNRYRAYCTTCPHLNSAMRCFNVFLSIYTLPTGPCSPGYTELISRRGIHSLLLLIPVSPHFADAA
jgi:hypothetical protein